MAPNFKMMALTMVMAFASNQMLDSSNPSTYALPLCCLLERVRAADAFELVVDHAMLVRVVYGLGQLFSYGVLTYMYFKAKVCLFC